jgi:ABC-2 type transport system ATP-binding protein
MADADGLTAPDGVGAPQGVAAPEGVAAPGGGAAASPGARREHPRHQTGGAPLIRTRRLTKRYGDLTAVDRLDLEVHRGEIFGLLGPNGAGKTTTILMLLGLSEPTDGEVSVVGLDPTRNPLGVKRRVGYLPDNAGFYGNMTGRQNLRYTARLNRLHGETAEAQIDGVLAQVGLTERADTRVDTYSRGMRQRLGIADALVKDPDVLILDEPTIAIDPIGVAEMLELMRSLVRERGMALLLASHLLDQVQSVCDRVGIFSAGRLIALGTVEELANRYGDRQASVTVGVEAGPDVDGPRIAEAFAALPEIAAVERNGAMPGELAWDLRVGQGVAEPQARRAILRVVLDYGLLLTRLTRAAPSLEQVYRRAVAQRSGISATPSSPGQAVDHGRRPSPRKGGRGPSGRGGSGRGGPPRRRRT